MFAPTEHCSLVPLRSGPYETDLEYLQDMFALVKLRSDVARVRRHMEERGQQVGRLRRTHTRMRSGHHRCDFFLPLLRLHNPSEQGFITAYS